MDVKRAQETKIVAFLAEVNINIAQTGRCRYQQQNHDNRCWCWNDQYLRRDTKWHYDSSDIFFWKIDVAWSAMNDRMSIK